MAASRSGGRAAGGPATGSTRTTTRLLDDLRDQANAPAWEAFDARYRPILTAFARRLGLTGEDAAELAQQTLAEFARSYASGRYERGQGRLGSWLIGIAANVGGTLRRRAARDRGPGATGGMMDDVADDAWADQTRLREAWDRERERAILAEAIAVLRASSRVQEATLRAFELVAIRGVPAAEVARQCAMSVDAVYVAKNRLTARLREIVRELTVAYDEDA